MLLGQYAIVESGLARVGVYDGQYGKTLILNLDDTVINEGVITERIDDGNGNADGKVKVFGWDKWYDRDENMELVPFDEGGEITVDNLGRRVTEEAGGSTYKYEVTEGVLEGRDEPVSIGDREIWLSNGKKARTLAKVFSKHGHDVVDEENKRDDSSWLIADDEDSFGLRDELEDRRVMFWFEQNTLKADDVEGLDQDVTFTDSVVLDAETEAGITIQNGDGGGNGGGGDGGGTTDDTNSDDASVDAASNGDGIEGFPEAIDELVDMFARTNQTNRESIETLVMDEAPADYTVDMNAVMAAVEDRA